MDASKIFRALVALGVPGVALGVFYLLLREFGFQFETIGATWASITAIIFLVIGGGVTLFALHRYAPTALQPDQGRGGRNITRQVETPFYQDLSLLIQHTENDFDEIKGAENFVHSDTGSVAYKSKFSFERSRSNDIWRQADGTHRFTCDFYRGDNLQEADAIYTKYAEQIKLALEKEWQFQEQYTPDRLHIKTLKGIRRYNTMQLELVLTAYKTRGGCEVTFEIEKEE